MTPISLQQFLRLLRRSTKQELKAPATDALDHAMVRGVAVDSRLINAGEVFFALPGEKVDGHDYIAEAAQKGAVAAVVRTSYSGLDYGVPLIKVSNGLEALQGLAKALLEARQTKIVAVTGSVGKTTTKEFLATFLRERYRVASSPGNSNSQIGLPLAIINGTKGDEEFYVQEMGMTDKGQIAQLVKIAPPYISLITSVEEAHIAFFKSIKEIALAKAEIFLDPHTVLGILPLGIANFEAVKATGACPKKTFSLKSSEADYYLEDAGHKLIMHAESQEIVLPPLNVLGKHNLNNLLAAIATARSLSVDWISISHAIPKLSLPERRMEQVEKLGVLFINDSYNAIPVAVKAALTSLPAPKAGGKRLFVLGGMVELGDISDKVHREVAELALKHVDQLICFGEACQPAVDCWTSAKRPAVLFTDFDAMVGELKKRMKPGDVVLLKGSRGKGMWRVLDLLEDKK